MKITSVTLYDADRNLLPTPGSVDILDAISSTIVRRQEIGHPETVSFTLHALSDPVLEIEIDGEMFFRRRRILRFTYEDASFREFRITRFHRDLSGETDARLDAEDFVFDLLDSEFPRLDLTGNDYVSPTIAINGRTPQDALNTLLSSDYNPPALIEAGTVDSAIVTTSVDLQSDGDQSFLALLRLLANQSLDANGKTAEILFSWNSGTGKYRVHFYSQIGWTAAERTAGTPSPTTRPIEIGPDTESNRRQLLRSSDDREYISRITPLGGNPDETVTIGSARYNVSAAVYSAPNTTLTVDDDPVFIDNAFIGRYIGNDASGFFLINDSTAPGTIVVTGNAAALNGTDVRFATDSNGRELIFIDHPLATDGIVEKRVRYSELPPFENLVAESGISANLSSWSAGLPVGFAKIGSPTVTEYTDSNHRSNGTSAAKVQAALDQGLETSNILLAPTTDRPYFSAWIYLSVESGSVRIYLEDSSGLKHPTTDSKTFSDNNLIAVKFEGMDPAAGNAKIKFVATENGTVFYVDAITLTNSASAYPYADKMGPRGLLAAAATELLAVEYADAYESEFWDVKELNIGSYNRVELGSHVSVKDAFNGTSHEIDFTARVVAIEIEEDPISGSFQKRARFSRSERDFSDRYVPDEIRRIRGHQQGRETPLPFVRATDLYIKSNGTLAIAYNGDERTAGSYVTYSVAASPSEPADPTPAAHDATLASQNGAIDLSAISATDIAIVKIRPYRGNILGETVRLVLSGTDRLLTWRGSWSSGYGVYLLNDAVSNAGSSYICIVSHNAATPNTEPGVGVNWDTYWQPLAIRGNDGSDGAPGTPGNDGSDGAPGSDGTDAIDARVVPSNGTGWIRAKHAGSWSPAGTTTRLDFDFSQGGTAVCRDAKLVTLDTGTGNLSVSDTDHPSGNLNVAGFVITGDGTSSLTITASYGTAEKTITVVAIQGGDKGDPGNDGSNGTNGADGADASRWVGEFEFQPNPDAIQTSLAYVQQGNRYLGQWATSRAYLVGDIVRDSTSADVFRCKLAHTSSAGTQPGIGGSWSTYWENSTAATEPDIQILAGTYTLNYHTPELLLSGSGFNYIYFDPDANPSRLLITTSLSTAVSKGTGGNRVLIGLARAGSTASDYAFFVPIGGTTPIVTVDTLYAKDLQALFAQIDDLTVKDVLTVASGGKLTNASETWRVDDDGPNVKQHASTAFGGTDPGSEYTITDTGGTVQTRIGRNTSLLAHRIPGVGTLFGYSSYLIGQFRFHDIVGFFGKTLFNALAGFRSGQEWDDPGADPAGYASTLTLFQRSQIPYIRNGTSSRKAILTADTISPDSVEWVAFGTDTVTGNDSASSILNGLTLVQGSRTIKGSRNALGRIVKLVVYGDATSNEAVTFDLDVRVDSSTIVTLSNIAIPNLSGGQESWTLTAYLLTNLYSATGNMWGFVKFEFGSGTNHAAYINNTSTSSVDTLNDFVLDVVVSFDSGDGSDSLTAHFATAELVNADPTKTI